MYQDISTDILGISTPQRPDISQVYSKSGIMSAEYHPLWDSRKASTMLLNKSGSSSISMCPASGMV